MIPSLLYKHCEWCGRPAGGELLCTVCERQQIWAIKDHANTQTNSIRTEAAAHTERGVLPEGSQTPRLSIRRAIAALGSKRYGRRSPVDCVQDVRQRHPSLDRIVAWPEAS